MFLRGIGYRELLNYLWGILGKVINDVNIWIVMGVFGFFRKLRVGFF